MMGSRLSFCDENIISTKCMAPYNKYCMVETSYIFGYMTNTYQCSDYCEESFWDDLRVSCCAYDNCNSSSVISTPIVQIIIFQIWLNFLKFFLMK
jgi:hypothetical protein